MTESKFLNLDFIVLFGRIKLGRRQVLFFTGNMLVIICDFFLIIVGNMMILRFRGVMPFWIVEL